MKSLPETIFFLHGQKEKYRFDLPPELSGWISQQPWANQKMMTLDNHSDASTMYYATLQIQKKESMWVIMHFSDQDELGSLTGFLNRAVRNPAVSLFGIGNAPMLTPFLKISQGATCANENEFKNLVQDLISKLSDSN